MPNRTLSYESLEQRELLTTATDIHWGSDALSAEHPSSVLPGNTSLPTFALDFAAIDGSRMARGYQNGTIELIDTASGAILHTIPGDGKYVADIALSPDGAYLAIGTGMPDVRVYDAHTYQELRRFPAKGYVYPLTFRGDEIFSSTWENKAVTVCNIRTGAIRTIGGGTNQINYTLAMNNRFYGHDERGTLKEIDPTSGTVLRSIATPPGSVPITSDASGILAMGTSTGQVLLFNAELQMQGSFAPGIGYIDQLGFDGSGYKLAVRGAGATVFLEITATGNGWSITEAGRIATGKAGRYELGLPLLPDSTGTIIKMESSITAYKTPWELPLPSAPVEEVIEEVAQEVQQALVLPEELSTLLGEAVILANNGPEWRAPDVGELQTTTLSRGAHINLRSVSGRVTGARATVYAGSPLTAHVYRGTTEIATVGIGSDGAFSTEDEDGITDIVFSTTNTTSVFVTGISMTTNPEEDTDVWEPLSIMNAKEYALAAVPPLPQQPTDIATAAQILDIRDPNKGNAGPGYEMRTIINRDPLQYTLVRMFVSQGNARIGSLRGMRFAGMDYRGREMADWMGLPETYVQRIDDATFAIAPGLPASLVITGFFSEYTPYNVYVINGPDLEALLPPEIMSTKTINTSIIAMHDQHITEGVFPPLLEVRENSSPVFASPGAIANVQYHVRNEALTGGTVIMDVYVGWYAGEPTRGNLENSFTFALGGGQTSRISVNVTALSKPSDATSDRPIISAILRLPDGTTMENTKLGKQARSMDTRVLKNTEDGGLSIEYTSKELTTREQARLATVTDRAIHALATSPDRRLQAAREALGMERIIALVAESVRSSFTATVDTPEEMLLAYAVTAGEEAMHTQLDDSLWDREGVGGSEDLPPNTEKLLTRGIEDSQYPPEAISAAEITGIRTPSSVYNEALSWAIPSNHALSDDFSIFNSSTVTGRMLVSGIMQMHSNIGNAAAQWKTAFMMQIITDIPAYMLMDAANAGSDIAVTRKFKALLEKAQYGHIASPTVLPETPTIVMAETHKVKYATGDQNIRIRFDVAGTHSGVRSVQVYDGEKLLNGARSIGFITISIIDMLSKVSGMGVEPEFTTCALSLRITLEDGTILQNSTTPFEIATYLPDDLRNPPSPNNSNNSEATVVGEYSTLSNTPENESRRSLENLALSAIKQNFPLDQSNIWLNTLGSPYHLGEGSAAMDLNINTGGDNDEDLPVKVVSDGVIEDIGLNYGSVRIKHIAHINGQERAWYTTYLHMRIVATNQNINGKIVYEAKDKNGNVLAMLYEGKNLNAKDTIGGICGRGLVNGTPNDHAFKTHLHMEAEDDVGNMIRFGKLLADMGIQTYVESNEAVPVDMRINGRINVTWNDAIDEWVQEAYGLIFDQENSEGNNNVWVAWTNELTERKRIKWDNITEAWFQADTDGAFIEESGKNHVWSKNSISNSFEFIWQ